MKLPDHIRYSDFSGYDLLLLTTEPAIQEKLDMLAENPAGKPWTDITFSQTGKCYGSTQSGSYTQHFRNGFNGNYGLAFIRQVSIRNPGTDTAVPESVFGIYYVCKEESFTSDCDANVPGNWVKYEPRRIPAAAECSVLTSLKIVQATNGKTYLEVDQGKSGAEKENEMPPGFMEAWRSRKALRVGFGFTPNDTVTPFPFAAAHPFVGGTGFIENKSAIIWLGVNREEKLPASPPSRFEFLGLLACETHPCTLALSSCSLMEWLLSRLCEELKLNITSFSQSAADAEIRCQVPYPLKFANGTVAREDSEISGTTSVTLCISRVANRADALCVVRIEVPVKTGFTHQSKTIRPTQVEFGFSSFILNQKLIPVQRISNVTREQKSSFELAVQKGFSGIAKDEAESPVIQARAAVSLPESDQFFYSKPRLLGGHLIVSAAPKY